MDGFAPGQIIDGRYRVVDALGEGGMGVVFRARHTDMDRHVAIKLLKSALLPDPDKVNRFMNEARTISRLKHQNIVNVYSVGLADNGQPYIAMEYIEGKQLSELIHDKGFLSPADALPLFIQVCEGLAHAHKHEIVHRDIKPSNIMIVLENGVRTAKVVDFGIAKSVAADGQALTQTGLMMGSAFYMSPGQCLGRAADVRSDVYSLGCTLYEALTGSAPLQGETIFETLAKQVNEDAPPVRVTNPKAEVSDELQAVLDCMMAKEAGNRYQTMDALKQDLERVLEGKKAAQIPEKQVVAVVAPKKQRWKIPAVILACAAVVGTAIAFGYFSHVNTSSPKAKQDIVAIIGRANDLEHSNRGTEAVALYEQALERATEAHNVHVMAEMQHRIGWNYHKLWKAHGMKSSEIETEKVAYRWTRRAISTLEPTVVAMLDNPKSVWDYEAKKVLTLLTITYDSAVEIALHTGDKTERLDMARRFVDMYDSANQYLIDRDRERAMYLQMLDVLIRENAASGNRESALAAFRSFETCLKEHPMDASEAEARTAEYKKLLKSKLGSN